VIGPSVCSRIKQTRGSPIFRIPSGSKNGLVQVARFTGECEVFGSLFAPKSARDNVVDLERKVEHQLWCPAILALAVCALSDGRVVRIHALKRGSDWVLGMVASKAASIRRSNSLHSTFERVSALRLRSSSRACCSAVKNTSPQLYDQMMIGAVSTAGACRIKFSRASTGLCPKACKTPAVARNCAFRWFFILFSTTDDTTTIPARSRSPVQPVSRFLNRVP
jgi:hypothetical protein